MENNKGIYTAKSKQLNGWSYSDYGYYFITICTNNKICYFGNIVKDEMQLTSDGKIAAKYLSKIDKHYSFVKLDNFVVMPNHIHTILIMNADAINRAAT